MQPLLAGERFGLVNPAVDAHTLGIDAVASLLRQSGYPAFRGDRSVAQAINDLDDPENVSLLLDWITRNELTRLGISCRLDPGMALRLVDRIRHALRRADMYGPGRGQIRAIAFAGLPAACELVRREFGTEISVFQGDESPSTTLHLLGVPASRIPTSIEEQSRYDEDRLAFSSRVLSTGGHLTFPPVDRSGYSTFGTSRDCLLDRLHHCRRNGLPPLVRAHYGPYGDDTAGAVQEFLLGTRQLAGSGHLDVLSIGTSQLTQERFGQPWRDLPNGGGVPINSIEDYRRTAAAARPMLVRTYAGTSHVDDLARVHEESLNMAWHALSLWWFSRIDGRGPNTVGANLEQHAAALRYIAERGKPFEPNIAHHFSFRGGDDVTSVLSAVLGARTAARQGVRTVVLQVMLNTPRSTLGVQDLAKARATLALIHQLEPGLTVILQPRAGLDYLSADHDRARVQLGAVTALMEDIEPQRSKSPAIIHVVSYSEGTGLATPPTIIESAQITQFVLARHRESRARGAGAPLPPADEVNRRVASLTSQTLTLLRAIEASVPDPYSAQGLLTILRAGFLAAPHLWEERQEFRHATQWQTALIDGGVSVVDDFGAVVSAEHRAGVCQENARRLAVAR